MTFIIAKNSNEFFDWTKKEKTTSKSYNIYSDGSGYYIYLPQWFIYETTSFDFLDQIESRYPNARFADNFNVRNNKQRKANKYYTGTALFISPFFLTAHIIELSKNGAADGYSKTYQLFVSIAAIFYWLLGAIAIYLLLHRLKIPKFYAILTIIAVTFGSNLFYYVVYAPAYAHVYSFACVSWILYLAMKWVSTKKNSAFWVLGFLIGIAFLIRPTNLIIVLFFPFLFKNREALLTAAKLLFTKKRFVLVLFLIFASLPLMFHFWNTFHQAGDFKLNTYSNEGFDYLASPYIFEVLFGVRKGIFFYAPVLLISMFGLIYLYRIKRHLFWGFIVVFAFFTYITASWWCWWYGGGFSMRPFIDIMVIFTIPFAFLLKHLSKSLRFIVVLTSAVCVWLTQIYSYQLVNFILHYDNITAKHFSEVFLQTDDRFRWHPFLDHDKVPETYNAVEKTVKFEGTNLGLLSIDSDSEDYFAARIKGNYKIENPDKNPFYHIKYYSGDEVSEKNIYFGSQITSVHEFQSVTLDIYPEIKSKALDSISINMYASLEEISAKDVSLEILKKRD